MGNALGNLNRRVGAWMLRAGLTRKQLAMLCGALAAASLVPLVLIALYNYPADDDFAFTLPAATAWLQTHSLWAALQAVVQKTAETYQTWQGNFVSTALFGLCPMVFDIRLYFISNWALLALVCLSVGYLLKGLTDHVLQTTPHTFAIAYFAVLVLVLQFMPSIGDGIYWHNGGQYTVAACTLFLTAGLLMRCARPQSRKRSLMRGILAALCGAMLGGSFYGPALGAFVLLLLASVVGYAQHGAYRRHALAALVGFGITFLLSVTAPGNLLRQERTGETAGVLAAVVTAVLDSFDLAGKWAAPQLWGALLLLFPALWRPLRESRLAFRHPFWVLVALYGPFAASLTPGIYTGFGYDTPRYLNIVYFYFLLWAIGGAAYLEGALIRLLERSEGEETPRVLLQLGGRLGERFGCLYLTACVALFALGGFGSTIMNTASLSAAKSLVSGEAAQFRQEMAERQEYIRVTESDVVAVQPLSVQPHVFKYDRLPFQGIYGRVRYMKWYFELFEGTASAP